MGEVTNAAGINVVTRAVASLIHYAKNPLKNDGAVTQMIASIKEFGFKIPVLAKSDGSVIDGHLRLKAAAQLGLSEVPVILCDDWTEAQVKAFRLLVNRSASWAEWDDELVALELADLKEFQFDTSMIGFSAKELQRFDAALPAQAGLTDEDAAPEPPVDPVSIVGDLWTLGKHRLLCGDSTNAAAVDHLFGGVAPNLMVTDPPYGVDYDPTWRHHEGLNKSSRTGKVANDNRVDWSSAYALFPGVIAYVWHAGRHASAVQVSLEKCGFEIRSQIVWAKSRFAISRGHYHWQHEPCWYAVKKGGTGNWGGDRSQTTLWRVDSSAGDETKTIHGTQKPVECMRRPILNHTNAGQCLYDPFMGSGTTIIAAESTGRISFGLEIDPAYIDVAVQRWQAFTGQAAVLDGDGSTFEEVAKARGKREGR